MMTAAESFESRLFKSYWDDGLLDVLAGVTLLGIAACWYVDLVAVGAVVPAVLASLWLPLRHRLVEPRIGVVEFSDARNERSHRLQVNTALFGMALLVLFAGAYVLKGLRGHAFLVQVAPAIPALLLALMAVVAGWGLGLPRFLGYAISLCLAGFAVSAANAEPEVAMLAGAIVILSAGTWRLLRFLQLPVESDEPDAPVSHDTMERRDGR